MRRLRDQAGQTAAEYMGVLLVVSVIIAAVSGTDVGGTIRDQVSRLVDCIASAGCPATHPTQTTSAPSGSPAPTSGPPATQAASLPSGSPAPTGGSPATQAAAQPQPNPQPGPAPAAPWPGQAANLPQSGDRPYVPPKSSRGQPKKVPRTRGKGSGYEDADGNVWEWDPRGHGGPHWDVQHPDGSHTNVYPDGHVRGPDNFPNKPRQPADDGGDSGDSGDGSDNTAKAIAGGAAVAGGGALLWWLGKAASPACGPLLPVCAIVF